jgi:hypothetical protein
LLPRTQKSFVYNKSGDGLDLDKRQLMKALTGLAIEKALLEIGKPVLEKVANKLFKEYQYHIPDCYEHREYLNDVLRDVFGNPYSTIVQSIKLESSEHLDDVAVLRLVKIAGR